MSLAQVSNSETLPIQAVTVTPDDKEFTLPHVFNNWSIRRGQDGDFVAPGGSLLVDSVIQIEATDHRPKVVTGKILELNLHQRKAKVQAGFGSDKIFHIYLGIANPGYDKFWDRTALHSSLRQSQLTELFRRVAE